MKHLNKIFFISTCYIFFCVTINPLLSFANNDECSTNINKEISLVSYDETLRIAENILNLSRDFGFEILINGELSAQQVKAMNLLTYLNTLPKDRYLNSFIVNENGTFHRLQETSEIKDYLDSSSLKDNLNPSQLLAEITYLLLTESDLDTSEDNFSNITVNRLRVLTAELISEISDVKLIRLDELMYNLEQNIAEIYSSNIEKNLVFESELIKKPVNIFSPILLGTKGEIKNIFENLLTNLFLFPYNGPVLFTPDKNYNIFFDKDRLILLKSQAEFTEFQIQGALGVFSPFLNLSPEDLFYLFNDFLSTHLIDISTQNLDQIDEFWLGHLLLFGKQDTKDLYQRLILIARERNLIPKNILNNLNTHITFLNLFLGHNDYYNLIF